MALGRQSIETAKDSMKKIQTKTEEARGRVDSFRNLMKDPNFNKFVEQTKKGTEINNQFNNLINWINQMSGVTDSLVKSTQGFISRQEQINQ